MVNRTIGILILTFFSLVQLKAIGLAQEMAVVPDTVTKIIKQIQFKYRPDNRIARFEVIPKIDGNKIMLRGETLSAEGKSELIERLKAETNFQVEDSLLVLPDPTLGKSVYGIVKISVAQLRCQPDEFYEIVDQALMGAEVRVLKIVGKYWVYCQLDDQYLGWMTISSLKIGDQNFVKWWNEKEKLVVIANYGQIWEQRKENGRSVSDVVLGNLLVNKGKKRGWYQVELPDGRIGYIRASSVIQDKKYFARVRPTAESLTRLAYRFIGFPYLWGGRSTKGFDCSGFTQTLYKMHGIAIPRDANMQVKTGVEVTIDSTYNNLKPGDLLFFGKDQDHIFHVGMYLGDQEFIHSDGMVRINSFNPDDENYSDYRRKGLQVVRRVLSNE